MYYLIERAKKIAFELDGLVYSNRIQLEMLLKKDGNYASFDAVEQSPSEWEEHLCKDSWGGWECHSWFRTKVIIPSGFEGKTAALYIYTGEKGWDAVNPQLIAYIDGKLMQGIDVNHGEVLIDYDMRSGREYQIDLHAYSGRAHRKTRLIVELVTVEFDIRRLYYNIHVPLGVLQKLSDNDVKKSDMLTVINSTVNLIDLRKPYSKEFFSSIRQANEFIEIELYQKLCGHEETTATCVGHTHIDVAWLWTIAQTREKVIRSFSTVLKLMEEYPEYIFMSSQPQLYKFLKEDQPEVYEILKERVKEGRWEPEGAMWLEADCNVSSGEALVRQILFGTRFFEKEFGIRSRILWLPDVFGYSAALPQLLKKSGIDYFMTTKISWNQFNKMPYDTFSWQGLDGSEILTYFITTTSNPADNFTTYNGDTDPASIMGAWARYQQKDINHDVLVVYGYGDGGGGPAKEMLETARRLEKGIPGCPRVKMGKAGDFFKRLEDRVRNDKRLPRWVGELYLEYHRGTYTSMGRNKRYNRKSELLYQDIELFSTLGMLLGYDYPCELINNGWETILLNQFHDILPGSSIKEVYDVSRQQYENILADGSRLVNGSLERIAAQIGIDRPSVIVFNTLAFERNDIVCFEIPENIANPCIEDEDGKRIACQIIHGDSVSKAMFFAECVPSKGYKTFFIEDSSLLVMDKLFISTSRLENSWFSIEIDEKGTFSSFYDKINRRQILKSGECGNVLLAFEDKPMNYDNWDIDIFYQEKMWEVNEVEAVQILEEGPVRGGVLIRRSFLDSVIEQKIYIYKDIPKVDFDTFIDWKESQILLKAAFPLDVHSDKATYDIQFGNVERPTHWNTSWDVARFEVCGHKWADLSEGDYGVSLMNDCKYGHDIKDGVMRLTLLKSGIDPNKEADKEDHRFLYSLYPHKGDWKTANTVQMAYAINVPFYTKIELPHEGVLPKKLSILSIDRDNVVAETIKKAEDSGDIIIRIYECHNKRSTVNVNFFKELNEVYECSLMEKELEYIPVSKNSFSFVIKPYEVKTYKIRLHDKAN